MGAVRLPKIPVLTIDGSLSAQIFSVKLPAHITTMGLLGMRGARKVQAVIVALSNGQVRVYNDKNLVSVVSINDEVTGMRFGKFGKGPSSHLSTRPNISESHSETSTRVPHCITGAVAGRSFEYPPEHQRVP